MNPLEYLGLDSVHRLYRVYPGPRGPERVLVGKFIAHGGHVHVLEDHDGLLEPLETKGPEETVRALAALQHNPYLDLVNLEDLRGGRRLDLLPAHDGGVPEDVGSAVEAADGRRPEAPAVFQVHAQGWEGPRRLEVREDGPFLDGQPVPEDEMQALLGMAQRGQATVRHDLDKHDLDALAKVEPKLAGALGKLHEAHRGGHVDAATLRTIMKEIFTDSLVPTMGNMKSYKDFLSRPKAGVHIHIDANDFGGINKMHGFEVGNQAIVALGQAIRNAIDESVGRKEAKSWRVGGDEFRVHVPDARGAARVARALRSRLGVVPAVGGTHRLSVSMGFGPNPDAAETALMRAKGSKKAGAYAPGQARTHVHSLVPGSEGEVPAEADLPPHP